jgi:hypothetical protein
LTQIAYHFQNVRTLTHIISTHSLTKAFGWVLTCGHGGRQTAHKDLKTLKFHPNNGRSVKLYKNTQFYNLNPAETQGDMPSQRSDTSVSGVQVI